MSGDVQTTGADHNDSIAVILPVYNGAAYLREAIESVLAQTLSADEILVIDDGSCDGSLAIAESFPAVQAISQSNSGVSASRNKGVAMTSSTWIAFLDHDDLWEPTKLQRQMETLRANPTADVCVTEYRYLQWDSTSGVFKPGLRVCLPTSDLMGRRLYTDLRFSPSCVMVRREAFSRTSGFDASLAYSEDWDLWLQLEQQKAGFVACHEPLMLYRSHPANASNKAEKMYQGELTTYERRVAPQVHPVLRPIHRLRAKSNFLAGMALVNREQSRPHLQTMLRSVGMFPFGTWYRYKILAHMLFKAASADAHAA